MIDYYAILSRAVEASEASDPAWRSDLYDRARRTLAGEMQARPRPERAKFASELAALEAAIARIEAEKADNEGSNSESSVSSGAVDQSRLLDTPLWRHPLLIAVALMVAAACAGASVFWSSQRAPTSMASRTLGKKPNTTAVRATKDGDLPPGIDGGPMDADQSYVFRRQPIFYRTLQPVGGVIIDKSQHFLYVVQPNSMALRYGIGIGRQCTDLIGLRHIASMAEWPAWDAPPDMVKQKLAQSGTLAGAPGNPLGARVLELDVNRASIHGTNAPKTIGTNVAFGCIRLVNDDIVDLYGRVKVGTPVLVN